jgi:hypothetical protein
MTTLKEFEDRVKSHDLTHAYSDDHRAWQHGDFDLREIKKMAEELPRADVIRVWNAMVDSKLMENARSSFYWKE